MVQDNNIDLTLVELLDGNFQSQINGEDNMDLLIRDIEKMGYDSSDYNLELVEAIVDQLGVSIEEALYMVTEYFYGFYDTVEDFIYDLVNETMEIPEHLQFYIDYKAIERDYMHDFTAIDMDNMVAIIANH